MPARGGAQEAEPANTKMPEAERFRYFCVVSSAMPPSDPGLNHPPFRFLPGPGILFYDINPPFHGRKLKKARPGNDIKNRKRRKGERP